MKYVRCTACGELVQLQRTRFVTPERVECVQCHDQNTRMCVYCRAKLHGAAHCGCYDCAALYSDSKQCHTCGSTCWSALCVTCTVQSQYATTLPEFIRTRYPRLADCVVTDLLHAVRQVETYQASSSSEGFNDAASVKF